MPTTNSTEKLRLSQYVGEDPVNFLQNYNNDMAKVDEGTLDVQTYDPDGVEGNAFRATNHKMTGYSKYSTYTPVLPSDTTAGAIGKLEAGVGSAGDMLAGTYDPMGVQGDAFSAANQKMSDYQKPSEYSAVSESDTVLTALGKVETASTEAQYQKMAGYQKPSEYSDIAATDNVRTAIGKLEARPIGDMHAQSYDPDGYGLPQLWPGAGPHNSIYRGKFLGNSVTGDQYAAIQSGTFDDLYIGDYWTIGGVNYRIAAFDYYYNVGDTPLLDHHAVIVPDKSLYNATMNATNITTGGYTGSVMRTTNLATAKTTIKTAFNGHVVNHRQLLVNAVTGIGQASGWAWFYCEVELMNEVMVYGSTAWGVAAYNSGYNVASSHGVLPLFAIRHDLVDNLENYWLRDVCTAASFTFVNNNGIAGNYNASGSYGVRPAFSIS